MVVCTNWCPGLPGLTQGSFRALQVRSGPGVLRGQPPAVCGHITLGCFEWWLLHVNTCHYDHCGGAGVGGEGLEGGEAAIRVPRLTPSVGLCIPLIYLEWRRTEIGELVIAMTHSSSNNPVASFRVKFSLYYLFMKKQRSTLYDMKNLQDCFKFLINIAANLLTYTVSKESFFF